MKDKKTNQEGQALARKFGEKARSNPQFTIWVVAFVAGLVVFPLVFFGLWWVTGKMVSEEDLSQHLAKLAMISGVVSCLVVPSIAGCGRAEKYEAPASKQTAGPERQTKENSGQDKPKQGTSKKEEKTVTINTEPAREIATTFDDIAGYAETKKNMEFIIRCLRRPDQLRAVGGKIPSGILLYGPPGTGKTLMARALAGTAGVKFYAANASEFVNIWVGQGAQNIRAFYQEAKKNAPSIVFIDEIDAIGSTRSAGQNQEYRQTLNALLAEMDGMDKDCGVLTIAATNVLDDLDPALIRPGRFDRKIAIPLPNYDDRLAIIRLYAAKRNLSDDISLEKLARETVGMSGSAISTLFNEASIRAVMADRIVITHADLDTAMTQMLTNGEIVKTVSSDELRMVAYHEAGHAILSRLVAKDTVQKVSIIGNTAGALGITIRGGDERQMLPLETLRGRAVMCYGGRAAEELVFGEESVTTGASQDLKDASRYIRAYLEGGAGSTLLDESSFAGQRVAPDTREAKELSLQLYAEARETLAQNRDLLDRVAAALMEKETLMEEDLEALF